MAYGTGGDALVSLFRDNWHQSRVGRDDVPQIIDESDDPDTTTGVLPLADREDTRVDLAKHDLIHCYVPEGNPGSTEDTGFDEQRIIEVVQIDVSVTDRTDHDRPAGEQRLGAKQRMVGDRGSVATLGDPPYPGILGEVQYILEKFRRGFDQYDTVSYEPLRVVLNNSNADVSLNVELEQIASNTVR
jgi:hypothetical protein